MPARRRGALVVVEGLDRAGKSTQCERLCRTLEAQGRKVKRMRFPDRSTVIGKSIDAYLKGEAQQEDHVIHLLFSANRWEAAAQIRANITEGITIVVDRYYYSGIVYSAAKNRQDLTLEWAREPEVGLPRPDICLFLDITHEAAVGRGGFGNEKYETSEMQERVRELFYELMRLPGGEDIRTVNASKSMDEVTKEILDIVEVILDEKALLQPLRSIVPWKSQAQIVLR